MGLGFLGPLGKRIKNRKTKNFRKTNKNFKSIDKILADERKKMIRKIFGERQDVRLKPGYPPRAWVWARVSG